MKIYTYKNCDTCRKAVKWLREKEVEFSEIPIRETPPSVGELKFVLAAYDGNIRRLFNTSGLDYRALQLKDKLPDMSEAESLNLLNQNGNLVKRPLLLDKRKAIALVGFKESEWTRILEPIP